MMMVMQGVPRSLQHWDSALEESGYSPRISTRVTPPAANDDSPSKGRTDPSMTPPLPSDAAASHANMLGETPSDTPTSGRQILEVPIIPDFDAKDRLNPSCLPPSDGLAADAHAPGQKVTLLPPIPESGEEGQAAEASGSVHLLGRGAVPNSPSKATCDDEHDPLTHVPKLAAASGDAAVPEIQSVQPAAQQSQPQHQTHSRLLTQPQASQLQPCTLLATGPLASPLLLCWSRFLRLPWLKSQKFLCCLAAQLWMAPLSWLSAALWTHPAAPP